MQTDTTAAENDHKASFDKTLLDLIGNVLTQKGHRPKCLEREG